MFVYNPSEHLNVRADVRIVKPSGMDWEVWADCDGQHGIVFSAPTCTLAMNYVMKHYRA